MQDDTGLPLPAALIVVKGTNYGTQTDFDGNFPTITDTDSNLQIISYIGYASVEHAINSQTSITLTLLED
ncbi:carboxypeptidase-like regulatory domain-containing protein [Arenibacter latericius]|uniref:carboxypeptidase-like regulatory domain-containing protein n=1 Tax=Arenibacter latericius TaxID=86104 RepID=UPI0003F7D429|nr:carboxypeptidase-like regulatory domain-containing protein [Arenibacter latericius]